VFVRIWSEFEPAWNPTMHKRKPSDDQNQNPNKFRKLESPQPVQNALMMSEEVDPSPSQAFQLPKDHTAGSESMGISSSTSSELSYICDEDLLVLNPWVKGKTFEGGLEDQSFPIMAVFFREKFRNRTELASRLKISTGNLEESSSRYREIDSDETLKSDLFDALSNVAKNPQAQTWKAVFNHRKLELNLFYRASEKYSSTLQKKTGQENIFERSRGSTNGRYIRPFILNGRQVTKPFSYI
jgi:hypothetical protein